MFLRLKSRVMNTFRCAAVGAHASQIYHTQKIQRGDHSRSSGFQGMCDWNTPLLVIPCIVLAVGFSSEEKYKSKTAWTTDGIRKWGTALEKIKQHSITEMHMTSMVRWTNFQISSSSLHLMFQM